MAATCTGQTTETHVQSTREQSWLHGSNMYRPKATETHVQSTHELSWLHGSNMYRPDNWNACTEYSWTVLVTWQQHVQARQLKHVYRVLMNCPGYMAATCTGQTTEMHVQSTRELSWLHGSNMYRPDNWNACTEYSWTVLVTWQQHVQARQLKHMYRVLVNSPGYMAATCTGQTTETHVQSTREQSWLHGSNMYRPKATETHVQSTHELSWLHGSNMYRPDNWNACTEYSWTVLVTWQQHVQAKDNWNTCTEYSWTVLVTWQHVQVRQLKCMYRVLVNCPGYMAATCTVQRSERHVQSTHEQSWLHGSNMYRPKTTETHVQSTHEQSWLHGSNIYRSDKWNTCTEYLWTVLVTCTGQTTETHAQSTHNSPCYRVASSTGQKQLKHTYTHCSHMQSWYHVVPHTLHAYRQTGGACSALREFFQCLLHFNLGKTKVLHSAFVWLTSKAHVESYGTDRAREVWHVDANLQPLHTSTMEWSVNLDDSLHIA